MKKYIIFAFLILKPGDKVVDNKVENSN